MTYPTINDFHYFNVYDLSWFSERIINWINIINKNLQFNNCYFIVGSFDYIDEYSMIRDVYESYGFVATLTNDWTDANPLKLIIRNRYDTTNHP